MRRYYLDGIDPYGDGRVQVYIEVDLIAGRRTR